mmetsp:Transcript_18642/g.34991  ORF Transcript_18642/g.34991 Transcript_18642/m.34991 type:complete len:165 (+) Transcript_18642:324-818(+)
MATTTLLSSSKSSKQQMQVVCEGHTLVGGTLLTSVPVEQVTSSLPIEQTWKFRAEDARELYEHVAITHSKELQVSAGLGEGSILFQNLEHFGTRSQLDITKRKMNAPFTKAGMSSATTAASISPAAESTPTMIENSFDSLSPSAIGERSARGQNHGRALSSKSA